MSNFHGYICDMCKKITNYNGILRFKLKSGSFVHYIVNDRYSPDEKKFDICTECAEKFKEWRSQQNKT